MWEIRVEWIADWLDQQDEATLACIYAAFDVLQREGSALGRPLVDSLDHAGRFHLKELRPASPGRTEIRIIFAFDPRRRAVMLLAGDKAAGKRSERWARWYRRAIPETERRLAVHLSETE